MIIVFTGTRRGMTSSQKEEFEKAIKLHRPSLFVHGGCLGADDEADEIAASNRVDRAVYFSDVPKASVSTHELEARSVYYCAGLCTRPGARPLDRNKEMVNLLGPQDILIACPRGREEELRSGTWMTVRFARKSGKTVQVIFP